jgi:hypothetical protein
MSFPLPRFSKPGSASHVVRPPASFTRSGGRFGPAQILQLAPAAWYRLGLGITTATGVSAWADQSGNGRNAVQATGSLQPIQQADGSLLFDGVDDFLKPTAFTLNQPVSAYILYKSITWTLNDRVYDGNASNLMALVQNPSTPQVLAFAGATGIGVSPAVGSLCVVSAVFNNTNSVIQLNQNAPVTGTVGTNNPAGVTLGAQPAGNFGNVQIYEFIVFPTAHDSATIRKVVTYLGGVGGLTL